MHMTETVYVPTRGAWRRWLARHHKTKREIWLIYYKKGSGRPRVAYGDAVEEALCFGWIDSTLKPIDAHCYAQRFTPRKRGSNWSTPNLIRVKRLIASGLMTPAGAVHVPSRAQARVFHAKHRRRLTAPTAAPRDLARALRAQPKAVAHWKTLAPGYRRLFVRWITEAKQADTRARRVRLAIAKLTRKQKHPFA